MFICRLFTLKPLTVSDFLQNNPNNETKNSTTTENISNNFWSVNTEAQSLDYDPAFRQIYVLPQNGNGRRESNIPLKKINKVRSFSPTKYVHPEDDTYSKDDNYNEYKTKRKRFIFASGEKLLRKSFSSEQLPVINKNNYQTQSLSSGSSSNSGKFEIIY